MPKHYEAMQRAEQERRRKATGGQDVEVTPVSWDATPAARASSADKPGFFKRLFGGRSTNAVVDTVGDLNKRRVALLRPDSYVAEQFRTLRGRIDSIAAQRPIRTIAVTSANPGEGKSTASVNLAVVTAMSVGRQVLLIDCDLRRPKVHKTLGIEPRSGLAEVLLNQSGLDEAINKVDGLNLDVLPVRSIPENPSELLASEDMRRLVEEVSNRYDRVILDTPACLGLPDSKTISELCDGLVLVVRADVTPREEVNVALDILDRRRVLGLVMNGVDLSRDQYGYY